MDLQRTDAGREIEDAARRRALSSSSRACTWKRNTRSSVAGAELDQHIALAGAPHTHLGVW
jgi:hypothetical protein